MGLICLAQAHLIKKVCANYCDLYMVVFFLNSFLCVGIYASIPPTPIPPPQIVWSGRFQWKMPAVKAVKKINWVL